MRRLASYAVAALALLSLHVAWTSSTGARALLSLALTAIATALAPRGMRVIAGAILYGLWGMEMFGVILAERVSGFTRWLGLAVHAAVTLYGLAQARR